jgi:hypothetical protein
MRRRASDQFDHVCLVSVLSGSLLAASPIAAPNNNFDRHARFAYHASSRAFFVLSLPFEADEIMTSAGYVGECNSRTGEVQCPAISSAISAHMKQQLLALTERP